MFPVQTFTGRYPTQLCVGLRRIWQADARIFIIIIACTFSADIQHILMVLVQGWTPLHTAVMFDETDVVGLLLARGADINAKDRNVSQHRGLLFFDRPHSVQCINRS